MKKVSRHSAAFAGSAQGEQGFWPSYADMMSAVALILFFLMLLAYIQNLMTGNDLQSTQEILEDTRIRLSLTTAQVETAEAELSLITADLDEAKLELARQQASIDQQQEEIDKQQAAISAQNATIATQKLTIANQATQAAPEPKVENPVKETPKPAPKPKAPEPDPMDDDTVDDTDGGVLVSGDVSPMEWLEEHGIGRERLIQIGGGLVGLILLFSIIGYARRRAAQKRILEHVKELNRQAAEEDDDTDGDDDA